MIHRARTWLDAARFRHRYGPSAIDGLLALMERLQAAKDFDDRFQTVCTMGAGILRCQRVSIFLSDGDYFRAAFNHGNPPDIARTFPEHKVRHDDPLIREAFAQGTSIVVNAAERSELMNQRTARRARIRAIAVAPIGEAGLAGSGFITAEFNEEPGRFGDLQRQILGSLGRICEIIVELRATERRARESRLAADSLMDRTVELEQRTVAAQQLSDLGRLAGGVAHDYNNLLTVILAECEMSLEDAADETFDAHMARTALLSIMDTARRATDLTRQLLIFSKRQARDPEFLDVSEVLDDMQALLKRLIEDRIIIRLETPAPAPVFADRAQLEQCVLNLVINARDAIEGHGEIIVRVETATDWVVLTVIDDGEGMAPEMIERITEPFFSTKGSRGTGLGLSTVKAIVEDHGGRLEIESVAGTGSWFRCRFPSAEPFSRPAETADPDRTAGLEARSVFIVDDDSGVRDVVAAGLKRAGCRVSAFASAQACLDALGRGEPLPEFLVTDLMMPGMSGRALADRVAVEFPGVSVLFASGYSEEILDSHGYLLPNVELIQKPFTARQLLGRLGDLRPRTPRRTEAS